MSGPPYSSILTSLCSLVTWECWIFKVFFCPWCVVGKKKTASCQWWLVENNRVGFWVFLFFLVPLMAQPVPTGKASSSETPLLLGNHNGYRKTAHFVPECSHTRISCYAKRFLQCKQNLSVTLETSCHENSREKKQKPRILTLWFGAWWKILIQSYFSTITKLLLV